MELEVNDVLGDNMTEYGVASWRRLIPSCIDGLKPVQRRILYTAYLHNTGKFTKNVSLLGKAAEYVDTGDAGIYQALVYMGQEDRHVHPLLEPQGNYGYITDSLSNYAASRYTESRISQYALDWYFTEDFKYTDWSPNYSNTTTEPTVLPTLMPMGLVQGPSGIAYVNASSMLPLSLKSVAKAYTEYLKIRNNGKKPIGREVDKILNYLEFGFINECIVTDVSKDLFKLGKGSVKLMGEYHVEMGDYGRQRIVITKLPYLLSVSSFLMKLNGWSDDIKALVSDINDESSGEGVRITITMKKNCPTTYVEEYLKMNVGFGGKGSGFKSTETVVMKFFSHKNWVVEEYNVMKMFDEHLELKLITLDRYFTALIDEYSRKLTYLEALLWIISDKTRVDQFIDVIKSSSKETLGDNLHKKFKQLSKEVLLYIAERKFTVMLKGAKEIKDQITDFKGKLKDAQYNKAHKIEYIINKINEKIKKY